MTLSMNVLMTATATVRRGARASGSRGAPASATPHLTNVPCTPPQHITQDTGPGGVFQRSESLVCFVAGNPDIRKTDLFTVGGVDYTVRESDLFEGGMFIGQFRQLILGDKSG